MPMGDSDDDVEIVGQQGAVAMRDWPHPRDRCLNVPFGRGDNAKVCAKCWCFICETPTAECSKWATHCNATDQDPGSIVERNTARRIRERSSRREEDQRPENVRAHQARQQAAAEAAQRSERSRASERAHRAQQGDAGGASDELPPEPEAEEEVEALFQAYKPELDFPGVMPHPTTAFETTSLSFVKLPPTDTSKLKLLKLVKAGSGDASEGKLSSLQMETVALATARHEHTLNVTDSTEQVTRGFFLGDGPGVGKGRQVAATIYENHLRGFKHHIWISVSSDLFDDAERDVKDIGCTLPVYRLNKLSRKELINTPEGGILFCTYSTLIAREAGASGAAAAAARKAATAATAAKPAPTGKMAAEHKVEHKVKTAPDENDDEELDYDDGDEADETAGGRSKAVRSLESITVDLDPARRLTQLVMWMTQGKTKPGDGTIIFDECHRAKNLQPDGNGQQTATGVAVLELQLALPKGKVVYCSATGCSSINGMAYMVRLGLWGAGSAFGNFAAFHRAIKGGSSGAMEMVALDMKMRGMYVSRMLSYEDCEFETLEVEPTAAQVKLYDKCVHFWAVAVECFEHAIEELDQLGMKPKGRGVASVLWGTHQRFFKQLCMSLKVPEVVRRTERALKDGHAVVIGLQTTGEARLNDAIKFAASDDELEDFRGLHALLEYVVDRFPCREALAERKPSGKGGKAAGGSAAADDDDDEVAPKPSRPPWAQTAALRARAATSAARADRASDSDGSDEEDALTEFQSMLASQKAFKRQCEFSSVDELKALAVAVLSSVAADSKKVPAKKDALAALLASEFEKLAKLTSAELAVRLGACGVSAARIPKTRRARLELLWKQRTAAAEDDEPASKRPRVATADAPPGAIDLDADDDDDYADCAPEERSTWQRLAQLRRRMVDLLADLELPENPLDAIVHALGGPTKVAELTGRKKRRVWKTGADGCSRMEVQKRNESLFTLNGARAPMAQVNLCEKKAFVEDQKRVAIISEAASSGISLHADQRFANQRRRVHITIELPWSADEAIQQFGRTHRSNQVSSPFYCLMMTTVGGERRFASSVAKRLQALGALTKGDRRANDAANLEVFNFENRYGSRACDDIMTMARHPDYAQPSADILRAVADPLEHSHRRGETGKGAALSPAAAGARTAPAARAFSVDGADVKPDLDDDAGAGALGADADDDADESQRADFDAYLSELEHHFAAVGINVADPKWERTSLPVTRFMNRVLGMPVRMQRKVFAHFSAQTDLLIKQAKEAGTYDEGVVDICARLVRAHAEPQVVTAEEHSGAAALYLELELDRGMSWDSALRERDHRLGLDGGGGGGGSGGGSGGGGFGGVGLSGFYEKAQFMPATNPQRRQVYMFLRMAKPANIAEALWVPTYRQYQPHIGWSGAISETWLRRTFRPVDEAQMKLRWKTHYEFALEGCEHGHACTRRGCMIGNRVRLQPFLAGCILPLWDVLEKFQGRKGAVKICRVRINDGDMRGQRLVGIKVDSSSFSHHLESFGAAWPNIKVTRINSQGQPIEGQLSRRQVATPERELRSRADAAARDGLPRRVPPLDGDDDEAVLVVLPEPRRNPPRQRRTIMLTEDEDPPDV